MTSQRAAWLVLLVASGLPTQTSAAVWGGFDVSRVNYPQAELSTGEVYGMLRGVLAGEGHVVAEGTSVLDADDLAGIDVFFTSLLADDGGSLTAAEQADLYAWLAAGTGTT